MHWTESYPHYFYSLVGTKFFECSHFVSLTFRECRVGRSSALSRAKYHREHLETSDLALLMPGQHLIDAGNDTHTQVQGHDTILSPRSHAAKTPTEQLCF
jgi:hypothetical protein